MKIFLDTSNTEEIRKAREAIEKAGGRLDGITTNPTSASQYAMESGKKPRDIFLEIADITDGPVSVEAIGCSDYDTRKITADQLAEEAHEIAGWHKNFVVKMPCTSEGLVATREICHEVPVNMTLVFSVDDALCTAHAGAAYCSPFVGRLDERVPLLGVRTAEKICELYKERNFRTEVLFASARSPAHIEFAYAIGSHICTIPYKLFSSMNMGRLAEMRKMAVHNTPQNPVDIRKLDLLMPRKEEGLKRFLDDAAKAGYRILAHKES
ncbi:MAG: transaldolase family protein [Candidatus Aenigmarchaeota archaeon]|nr:transaldolase family protein [Candidatus Aenigmarchaeota archaeon]MDI6722527.1 transaldolase family protein [Candidatus Aenigmarchaeota archaeon]